MFTLNYNADGNFVLTDVADFSLTALDTQDGVQALDSVREFISSCSMASKEDYLEWRRMYKRINSMLTSQSKKFKKLRKHGAAESSEEFQIFLRAYNRSSNNVNLNDNHILTLFNKHRSDIHLYLAVALHELYNARRLFKYASCEAYRRTRMKAVYKVVKSQDWEKIEAGFVSSV